MSRTTRFGDKYAKHDEDGSRRSRRLALRRAQLRLPDQHRVGRALVAYALAKAQVTAIDQATSERTAGLQSVTEESA